MNYQNCRAIISGGSSGLGLATAQLIASQGGKAFIFDVKEPKYENLLADKSKNIFFLRLDVTNEKSIEECIKNALKKVQNFNLLVNCAGIGIPEKVLGKNGVHSAESFSKTINVNLIGTFNLIKYVALEMQHNKEDQEGFRGVIINTASIAAYDGQIGQAAYSASKGGIVSLTLPLAREFAKFGIRVCTIAPGLFETPMLSGLPEKAYNSLIETTLFPKRLGKPEEFAKLVMSIFFNNMLNGEVIRLDGSLRMAPK